VRLLDLSNPSHDVVNIKLKNSITKSRLFIMMLQEDWLKTAVSR
jgi:hypothetical protein